MSKVMVEVKCDYCGKNAERVRGDAIYPHRPDLSRKTFYLCQADSAYVGCHPGTEQPLGRLANAELRKAKMRAHAAFDPIWKNGGCTRREAYRWLAGELGIPENECHIGMFNVETCARVVTLIAGASGQTKGAE